MITDDDDFSERWAAKREAERADGRRCCRCDKYQFSPYASVPGPCADCLALATDDEEVHHDSRMRCPACGHEEKVDCDWGHLYEEGEHRVSCQACEEDFTVSTRVEYTFVSPPRKRAVKED